MRMIVQMAVCGFAVAMASSARAQSMRGAEAFVRAVYASYSEAPGANPWGGDRVFSVGLKALMARDGNRARNCPIWTWIRFATVGLGEPVGASVMLAPAPGYAADATVRFINAGDETTNVLRLVRQASGWRIDDIAYPETGSGLAAALAESNARIEAGGKTLYRD